MAGRHRAGRTAEKRSPRVVETSDYVAMMTRIIRSYGDRIAADPVALAHAKDLVDELQSAVNVGVFRANEGSDSYSMPEIARILGVSRQAIQQRAHRGRDIVYAATGTVRLADIREARRRLLAAAEVVDRTGSERELRAV